MKRILYFVVCLMGTSTALWAQSSTGVRELKPYKVLKFGFSDEELAFWLEAETYMNRQLAAGKDIQSPGFYEKASKREKAFLDSLESGDSPYNTDHRSRYWGNNWLFASSLNEEFGSRKEYDFNLATCWFSSPGSMGTDEHIRLVFEPVYGTQIKEIMVYPGNMRSKHEWVQYSRPKQIKLRINGHEVGMLHLNDEMGCQLFVIPSGVPYQEKEHVIVELEVVSVYNGSTYRGTAISEINFNGTNIL